MRVRLQVPREGLRGQKGAGQVDVDDAAEVGGRVGGRGRFAGYAGAGYEAPERVAEGGEVGGEEGFQVCGGGCVGTVVVEVGVAGDGEGAEVSW